MNRRIDRVESVLVWLAGSLFVWSVVVLVVSATCDLVGGRAPSPSPGVATATPAVSEMAPARPLSDQGQGGTVEAVVGTTVVSSAVSPTAASTVTQSALTAVPSATISAGVAQSVERRYTSGGSPDATGDTDAGSTPAPSAVPATPVTSARPVETIAPKSDISALIASSPWPQSLWGTVACLVERESKGNAGAVGLAGERGLMQIGPANIAYLAEQGIAWDALFDGPTNLAAGWVLYVWWQGVNGDGFTPWKSTRGGCA